MKPATAIRGAALPETALVLTATLAMIFGVFQIGVLGFLQLMCDGAAFVAAHEYALGNATVASRASATAFAQHPFPLISSEYYDPYGPDVSATSVPVNFNESSPTARTGGVSLIRPGHAQATIHIVGPSGLLSFGVAGLNNVDIHGSSVEPYFQLSNHAYDVNAQGYSGTGSPVDFFSDQENTALYYVSSHRLVVCEARAMTTSSGYTTPALAGNRFDTTCPQQNQVLLSLGTAAYLDQDNWTRTTAGVGIYPENRTFGEVLCHQVYFAYAASTVFTTPMPSNISISGSPYLAAIYGWDRSFPNKTTGTGNETWGQNPLTPSNDPSSKCETS